MLFADICSAFVSYPTSLQLKLTATATLVLYMDAVTLNNVTRRSPTNNGFSIQVHGRPFFIRITGNKISRSHRSIIANYCSRSSFKLKNSGKDVKLRFTGFWQFVQLRAFLSFIYIVRHCISLWI